MASNNFFQQEPTLADIPRPTSFEAALVYDAFLILGAAALVTISARPIFDLNVGSFHVTWQMGMVILMGMILGSKRGALALLLFAVEGVIGFNVLEGEYGLELLSGATGGYLIGYIAGAFVAGWLAEIRWDRYVITSFLAVALSKMGIYAFILPWQLVFWGYWTVSENISNYVVSDLVQALIIALLMPVLWRRYHPQTYKRPKL